MEAMLASLAALFDFRKKAASERVYRSYHANTIEYSMITVSLVLRPRDRSLPSAKCIKLGKRRHRLGRLESLQPDQEAMSPSHHTSTLAMADTAYIHEWVNSTFELSAIDSSDVDKSLAARLYVGCMIVLRGLCSGTINTDASQSSLEPWILGQELGRMYLWGEGLGNGKLDKARRASRERVGSIH